MKHDRVFTFKLGEGEGARSFSYPLAEVRNLAKALGMDLELDKEFMWFLKQALVTILPQGWRKEVDPMGLTQYHNQDTGTTTEMHPLLYVYRAAFNRLIETTLTNKVKVEKTEERKLTSREKRLEPTDIVSLQSSSDQSTHFSSLLKKTEQKQFAHSSLSHLPAALLEADIFYSALLPDLTLPTAIAESLEYKSVDPREMLEAARELGLADDIRLMWLARLYCAAPLPPLWKRTYDAFRNIVYVSHFYDIVVKAHPGLNFFMKMAQKIKFKGVGTPEKIMKFVDREFREYDVDLYRLIAGASFVMEIRPMPIFRAPSSLFLKKSRVTDTLNDLMALEIAESCGISFSEDLYLMGLVYQHLSDMKQQNQLAGWEFRYTIEGQKYWYHPDTQRASKSYPFRSRLKAALATARLTIQRKFEKMGRDTADLHACFLGQSNDFVAEVRTAAAEIVENHLYSRLSTADSDPQSVTDLVKSLNFTPKTRPELDAILFACPFRISDVIAADPQSNPELGSDGESIGAMEQEEVRDMLDDLKRDIQKPQYFGKMLATKAVMGLIAKPKLPAPQGYRKGGQKPGPIPPLMPNHLTVYENEDSAKRPATPVVEDGVNSEQKTPRPASLSISDTVQSIMQNLIQSKSGTKGSLPGRIFTGSTLTAASPSRPLPENTIITDVLSDKEISVLKSLREKLNLPSIEIAKKTSELFASKTDRGVVKPTGIDLASIDSPEIEERKKSRAKTNSSVRKSGDSSPRKKPSLRSSRMSPTSKDTASSPKSPQPVKRFTIRIERISDDIVEDQPVDGTEVSFPRTEDEEEKTRDEGKPANEVDEDAQFDSHQELQHLLMTTEENDPTPDRHETEDYKEPVLTLESPLGTESEQQPQDEELPPFDLDDQSQTSSHPLIRRNLSHLFRPLVMNHLRPSPKPATPPINHSPLLLPDSSPTILRMPTPDTSREETPSRNNSGELSGSLMGMYAKRSFAKQKERESSSIRDALKALADESGKPLETVDKEKSSGKKNPILEILAEERTKRLQTESKSSQEELEGIWSRIASSAEKPSRVVTITPSTSAPDSTPDSAPPLSLPSDKPLSHGPQPSFLYLKPPTVRVTVSAARSFAEQLFPIESRLLPISEEFRTPESTPRLLNPSHIPHKSDEIQRKVLPPISLKLEERRSEDSCIHISKRSTSCYTTRTISTEVESPIPRPCGAFLPSVSPFDIEEAGDKADTETVNYYTTLIGGAFTTPDMRRFPPILTLVPAHIVLMSRRMGIHASLQPFESRESDLLWIAYLQLVIPPPATYPLLHFATIVGLPPGHHPGDRYFAVMLEYHRTVRVQELRHMEKGKRVKSVVDRSWLEFWGQCREKIRYNFMTGEEVRTREASKDKKLPVNEGVRTSTPHFAKLLNRAKSRLQKTSSCRDFPKLQSITRSVMTRSQVTRKGPRDSL